jgi:hypothetical protein
MPNTHAIGMTAAKRKVSAAAPITAGIAGRSARIQAAARALRCETLSEPSALSSISSKSVAPAEEPVL